MKDTIELPIIPFPTAEAFEAWLALNHDSSKGIWLQIFKKNSGVPTVSYAEAVEISLCYGWIDSQLKSIDEKSYKQKFTPRGSKSIWSKINTEHVKRLNKLGRMKPSGMAAVNAAKADGRWDNAYASPTSMTLPEAFLQALEKNKKAKNMFESLNKTNKYAIGFRLQTAKKPETVDRRIQQFITMLEKGEKLH